MNRAAQAILSVVALALIAAGPPSVPKPVPPDDPADVAALNRIPGVRVHISRNGSRTYVGLHGLDVDVGSVLPLFERLHNVRFLNAWSATDDLLKAVRSWPLLEGLDLTTSSVTDEGLRRLRGSKNLTYLNLRSTQIRDPGLEHIASLKTLVELDISQTEVTDAGIRHLTALTALERLHLGRTHISDKGLEFIARLENLKELGLWSTPVSDAGIGNLSRLHNLEVLILSDTNITDVGVAKLKSLHRLRFLLLSGALATEEVLKDFDLTNGLDISGLRTKANLLNLDNPADVAALRAAGVPIETNDLRNITRVEASRWRGSPGDWLPKLKNLHSLTILELPKGTTDADMIRVCELKSLKRLKSTRPGSPMQARRTSAASPSSRNFLFMAVRA